MTEDEKAAHELAKMQADRDQIWGCVTMMLVALIAASAIATYSYIAGIKHQRLQDTEEWIKKLEAK